MSRAKAAKGQPIAHTQDGGTLLPDGRASRSAAPINVEDFVGGDEGELSSSDDDRPRDSCHSLRLGQIAKQLDRRDLLPYARTAFQKRVATLAAAGFDDDEIARKVGHFNARRIVQAMTYMRQRATNKCLAKGA
jgi:hypothetical protein